MPVIGPTGNVESAPWNCQSTSHASQKRAGDVEDFEYMIGHTNIPQAADLEKACRKAFGKPPLAVFELGGVVSANTGPDTVALTYTGHPRG